MRFFSMKSVLIPFIALLGLAQAASAAVAERVVAEVDGYLIMESQVQKVLGKKANNAKNRQAALDKIIDDLLVQRAIQEANIPPMSVAQLDRIVESVAYQNGLTYGQLLDALDEQGMTLQAYYREIEQQLRMEQVRQISIGKSIQVDRDEVIAKGKSLLEQDKAKGKVKKSQGKEHRVSHILLKNNPIMTDKKAKAQLNQILADIKAGRTTFEQAAKAHSVDYLSGADGGDLGWNVLDVYDEAFANVAAKSKIGVISAPFKSQFGWHILKVTNTRPTDRTEDAYNQRAYELIVDQQAREASRDWVKALRKTANIRYIHK